MESTRRHKRIVTLQAKILAGVVGVIMALTGISGAKQAIDNSQVNEAAELIGNRAEFWKVVAGEAPPNASNVQMKLAIQLRDELGDKSVQVTELPAAIQEFRAGANDFGGIEERIGLNPFNPGALKCETCGALSAEMQGKLLFIKQGKLDQVLSNEQAAIPTDRALNLTPFDMSLPVWIGLVYLSSTTAALVISIRVDAKRNGYSANLLSWKYEGGTTADRYRKISRRLSPLYTPIILRLERKFDKSQDGDEILESMNLAESEAKLRQALRLIQELPATERGRPEVIAQRELIEGLLSNLADQVYAYSTVYRPMSVGRSVDSKLSAIQQLTDEAASPILGRESAIEELARIQGDESPRGQTATG